MEQSVLNVDDMIDNEGKSIEKIVLMSTPAFLKKAQEMGLMQKWVANSRIIPGFHIHPDDLLEEITIGLASYNISEKLITSYTGQR